MTDTKLKVMTIDETAAYLNLHKSTIYRLVNQKKIPAMKLGGQWRFKKDAIDAWVGQEIDKRMDKIQNVPATGLDKISEEIQNTIVQCAENDTSFAILKFSFPEKTEENTESHKALLRIVRKVVRTGRDSVLTKGKDINILLKDTGAKGIEAVKNRILYNSAEERQILIQHPIYSAIALYPNNGSTLKELTAYLQANAEKVAF